MRRLFIFAGPLVVAAFAFACENDPSGGPGGDFRLDAGAFDATQPTDDAARPDARQPDAPQPVTVVVSSLTGVGQPDVTVVFHDESGAVLETKKTGTDGKAASAVSPEIAMATVVFGEGTRRRELLTWTGVQGGDVLPAVVPAGDTLAEVQITIPGQFTGAGGPTFNYYAQVGDCEYYSTIANEPIRVFVEPYCYTGAGAVLVAGSNTNDIIVAHAVKKPVALATDGGVTEITTDTWMVPTTDVTVSLTNSSAPGRAFFHQIANETAFGQRADVPGDPKEVTFKAAGSFADAYNAAVVFESGASARSVGKRVAPASTIAIDGAQIPPALTGGTVSAIGSRPKLEWTGNMGAMKGGLVRATWFDRSTEGTTAWSVIVPANNAAAGSVTAPALPASLEGTLPLADGGGSTWDTDAEVVFVDSDLVPDYAAWRRMQATLVPPTRVGFAERIVLPQNGSFRVSHWTRAEP